MSVAGGSADAGSGGTAAAKPWAPLRRPLFRSLWLAQLTSNIGSWMQSVGAQWFLVEHSGSPAVVALVQTAGLLPMLFLSIPAGVFADSVDRRKLLLVMTVGSAAVAAVNVALGWSSLLTPVSLLLLTFLLGCTTALTNPAWQAIQPELVPPEEIPAAASLASVTVNGARAIGPAIAGFLVALSGPTTVFALNALSFVAVFFAVWRWQRPPQTSAYARERFVPAMRSGLRYIRSAPGVRRILLRSGIFAAPASALWALLPIAATETLGLSAGGYGVLLGVLGAGAVAGVAIMPVARRRLSNTVVLASSCCVFALGTLAISAALPLPLVLAALCLAGVAWIMTLTTLNATLQLAVPAWVRARAMGVYLLVFMGSQGVGSFIWGLIGSWLGTGHALQIAAGLLLLAALSLLPLPLHPQTGTLDRTITSLGLPTPALVFEPDPTDPVVVAVTYHVPPDQQTDFLVAMRRLELSRRRTGASAWRLDRDAEVPDLFREEFTVPSWQEHQRSADDRWTAYDQANREAARGFADEPVSIKHFFPIR